MISSWIINLVYNIIMDHEPCLPVSKFVYNIIMDHEPCLGKYKAKVENKEKQRELENGVTSVQVGIEDAASSGNLGKRVLHYNKE